MFVTITIVTTLALAIGVGLAILAIRFRARHGISRQGKSIRELSKEWVEGELAKGKSHEDLRNEALISSMSAYHDLRGKVYGYVVRTTELGYHPSNLEQFARTYLQQEHGLSPENLERRNYSVVVDSVEEFLVILVYRSEG